MDRSTDKPEGKVRENRARRAARRQALVIVKSRTRDPRALDFGRYALDNFITGNRVWGYGEMDRPSKTLDEIEAYLDRRYEEGKR
jgi:hypothetical protein